MSPPCSVADAQSETISQLRQVYRHERDKQRCYTANACKKKEKKKIKLKFTWIFLSLEILKSLGRR